MNSPASPPEFLNLTVETYKVRIMSSQVTVGSRVAGGGRGGGDGLNKRNEYSKSLQGSDPLLT